MARGDDSKAQQEHSFKIGKEQLNSSIVAHLEVVHGVASFLRGEKMRLEE